MNYIGNEPAPGGTVLVGDTNPIGLVAFFHAPPDASWKLLNGQLLAKATYPDLWAYGQGFLTADQATNPGLYRDVDAVSFALPKLDGMFIRAAGQVDANHAAAGLGVKQADANLAHLHTALDGGGFQTTTGGPSYGSSVAGSTSSATTNSVGGPEARPVNVALVACVKALRTVLMAAAAMPEVGLAPGTLAGFAMGNNVADAVNDIDVAPGKCRGTGDAGNIVLSAAMTKQLDAVWAPGSGAGMRASGAAIADGTYHVFAIRRTDSGAVDIAADTSVTGANIAANTNAAYTQLRRIGSILRLAGSIVGFVQTGDLFLRKAASLDMNVTGAGAAAILRACAVPVGIKVEAIVNITAGSGASGALMYLSSPDQNDEAPLQIGAPGVSIFNNPNSSNGNGPHRILTNTAAQIRTRGNAGADPAFRFSTLGWIDRRGRDDV